MTRNDIILHEEKINALKQEIKALITAKHRLANLLSRALALAYSFLRPRIQHTWENTL